MKHLKRVLCAVDIDDADRAVFDHALALARRAGASLLIVHAASPVKPLNEGATERVDFLRRLRAAAEAAGVDVRVDVQRGDVAGVILLHAAARHPDLVVVGGGRDRTPRFGSVTERVIREAQCYTMVIPHGHEAAAASFERILCAVDFSPASDAVVQEALRLGGEADRSVTLFHVVDGPGPEDTGRYPWLATHEYYRGLASEARERLQNLIPVPDRAAVTAQVSVGNAAAEIIRQVEATKTGLLVIGARPRSRIGRRLFATTGMLLRHARCPVLAVPGHAAAQAHAPGDVRGVAA